MPPISKPIPRFFADAPREGIAYGAYEQTLADAFVAACAEYADEAGPVDPATLRWFPDRSWGGRTYVPVIAFSPGGDGSRVEYYGHVSFFRPEEGDLEDLRVVADFTDVTAEDNPDWKIDLNDDVIGQWRSEKGRGGDVTLIWGVPLVRGPLAATAEINGDAVDQIAVTAGRFTLLAVDAIKGFGEEMFIEVAVWDKRLRELARDSLYDIGESEDAEDDPADAAELEDE